MEINNDTWRTLHAFQSADMTRNFLYSCYQLHHYAEADLLAYDNCYSFMYYLEQGEAFYQQASISPISVKPVLLYYGLVHLIKACLLTVDPLYPETTSVLAHGVTTRKRKKRNYTFINDEVKVQKNGLCTYFAEQLFHVKQLEGEKFKMGELLSLVVEMEDTYHLITRQHHMMSLIDIDETFYKVPEKLFDHYHMDNHRFKDYINHKCPEKVTWNIPENSKILMVMKKSCNFPPFRYHISNKKHYLPNKIHPHTHLPDLLIHYLLLYNLSMISRYETEWWMELIKTTPNLDFPFIRDFLNVSEHKSAYLISTFLKNLLEQGNH